MSMIMITKITDKNNDKTNDMIHYVYYSGRVDTLAPSVLISILDNDNKDNR